MRLSLLVGLLFCCLYDGSEAKLEQITEDNWKQSLKGEWMLEFFAPWCPACRGLQPTWEEFSTWAEDLEIQIGQVDVTESPGLSGRFLVTALPTIYHVKDGVFRQYRGARDKDSFIAYVEERKWEGVEPVSEWKHPDSIAMSLVSYFFKLSMVLRQIHTTLTETYDLPYWASYIIFALVTVILGGILGLMMVCCIDCIWPPRHEDFTQVAANRQNVREDKKDSDAEEEDDQSGVDSQDEETELSQDEAGGSQDEDEEGSQNEDEGSQGEEEEGEEEREEAFRGEQDNSKARRRKPRKAD